MAWIGLFGVLSFIVKSLFTVIHRAWRLAPVLASADTRLEDIKAAIDEIKHEVQCNSGESLKDAVLQIKQQTAQNSVDIRKSTAIALDAQRAAKRAEKMQTQAVQLMQQR